MYVKEKSLDGTKWIINIVNVYHSNSIFGTKIEFMNEKKKKKQK